nr:hypothetical protein [Tanacetum cinerariifolium]
MNTFPKLSILTQVHRYNISKLDSQGHRTINARGSQNYEGMVDPGYEKLKQTLRENKAARSWYGLLAGRIGYKRNT